MSTFGCFFVLCTVHDNVFVGLFVGTVITKLTKELNNRVLLAALIVWMLVLFLLLLYLYLSNYRLGNRFSAELFDQKKGGILKQVTKTESTKKNFFKDTNLTSFPCFREK